MLKHNPQFLEMFCFLTYTLFPATENTIKNSEENGIFGLPCADWSPYFCRVSGFVEERNKG